MATDLLNYQIKLQQIDWSKIVCLGCGAPIYLTRDSTWFHRKTSQSACAGSDFKAAPDLDKAVYEVGGR